MARLQRSPPLEPATTQNQCTPAFLKKNCSQGCLNSTDCILGRIRDQGKATFKSVSEGLLMIDTTQALSGRKVGTPMA